MRLKMIQIVAALAAAVAFLLAFMAAGVVFVSTLFMIAGLAAVAWLAWSLLRAGNRGRRPARAGRP
ncbi:MAG: hypothetical protein H2038_10390 [Brevundimonas sp.]|jgi:threonine/homoserine/homoserine lactone efflux protein|uniref:hypothetical protein n=1 Tax=Brevundimonas sp. TaxID=1871086 RepID=UPI001837BD3D|nr:hypothetical protein [Brevundimonas sp.]MBA4805048.1 hypothetical protein [Brevundimonas sp.]